MLKLENIKKEYIVADYKVEALKGIDVSFRENEFVAILGPSGSGKTTLLNIIGGLDHYSSGNLIINGRVTKNYQEKDWNVYRSHRVGFVFQSYNLIPHQTVLSNVELSLTIAGLPKEERIKRAKEALDEVGLSDQYYKKPNQLSGGQSQRVAIARALVNNPEILLADEPTGALDTVTSKQIMDLIKKIAKDRLVIMVTHNPDLANEYANRIINLLDGKLISDSNPVIEELKTKEVNLSVKEKAKMSLWTSFRLSLQNLISKKSRTILTSVASSIGIIGISLVLSLSYGVQSYIKKTQEDLLSGNPITISSSGFDLEAMLGSMGPDERIEVIKKINEVGIDQVIETIAKRSMDTNNMLVDNNINEDYLEFLANMPKEHLAAIFYNREIDITNNLYLDFTLEDGTTKNMSMHTLKTIITAILEHSEDTKPYANLISNFTNVMKEAPSNLDYIETQYQLLGNSKMPSNKNEIVLVLNRQGLISDLTLAQLGFYSQSEFQNIVFKAINSEDYNEDIISKTHLKYDEILGTKFMWHSNDLVFKEGLNQMNPYTYVPYGENIVSDANSLELEIVGILELKEGIEYGSLSSGFYYTSELTDYILDVNGNSSIINYLIDNDDDQIASMNVAGFNMGIIFDFEYQYLGSSYNKVGFVGKTNQMMDMISSIPGMENSTNPYVLTKRDLGGEKLPSLISIFPKDLKHKEKVLEYLNTWNDSELGETNPITYNDSLSIVFAMIANIVNIITIALIGFTSLALFVSSVMIAIITYVSVVERVKEIGVIRSLGGSKNNVSNLFISETFIIGLISALIAILFTYLANIIINVSLKNVVDANIAIFPIHYALLMILISVTLTLISGFIPSRSAAKKDPVVALRSE